MGDNAVSSAWPQFLLELVEHGKVPMAILDRQLVKHFSKASTRVLVQWSQSTPKEPTMEYYDDLQTNFPEFCLENH